MLADRGILARSRALRLPLALRFALDAVLLLFRRADRGRGIPIRLGAKLVAGVSVMRSAGMSPSAGSRGDVTIVSVVADAEWEESGSAVRVVMARSDETRSTDINGWSRRNGLILECEISDAVSAVPGRRSVAAASL